MCVVHLLLWITNCTRCTVHTFKNITKDATNFVQDTKTDEFPMFIFSYKQNSELHTTNSNRKSLPHFNMQAKPYYCRLKITDEYERHNVTRHETWYSMRLATPLGLK